MATDDNMPVVKISPTIIEDSIAKLMGGEQLTPREARHVVRALAPNQVRILAANFLTDLNPANLRAAAISIDVARTFPAMAS